MRGDRLALDHARGWHPGELFLVPPVAAEVEYGLARLPPDSRRRALLTGEYARWRKLLRWLDWEEEASRAFGREKARLEVAGSRIDDMDLAIAAIALSRGLAVATLNSRHFRRIEGLEVHDWSKPPATP